MTRTIAALALSISACNYVPSAPEQHTLQGSRNPGGQVDRVKEAAARAGAVGLVRDEGPTPANSPEL